MGGKRQPARCSRKTQEKVAIASKAKKLLHRCMGAHHRGACTGACAFFAGSVVCIQTGVVSTMHVQVFTLNRCCVHQRIHLRTRSLQDVHMRSCMCSLFISALVNEDGGVQLVYYDESTCCLA